MHIRFVLALLTLFPVALTAQTESLDSTKLKTSLSVSGFLQGGNVETTILRINSDVIYKPWKKWIFNTRNSYIYQKFGQVKADEDFLSLNFIYFNPDKKIYPLILGFVSTNFRRRIDLRYLVGGGITFRLLDKKRSKLKISISSEFEKTTFNQTNFNKDRYDNNSSINTLRATLWAKGHYNLFKKNIIFSHENYFQPSLTLADNFRWQADMSLEFPIWSFLSFRINYRHTYESIVIQGQEEQDQILTFGFTIKNF